MNPERAVVGLVTVFEEPDINEGEVWRSWQFADFVSAQIGVPMLLEHRDEADPLSAGILGTWRTFATLAAGTTPAGLLGLGELGHSPIAEDLLRRLAEQLDPWRNGPEFGLSVTAFDASEVEDRSRMWVKEVSLTTRPAHPMAKVLGVGPYALDVWRLLTGTEPPTVAAVTARTVRGRLLGVHRGRPIYEEWQE